MTALTTTQTFFDQHNMVQGSLSFLTVGFTDPFHKYWSGTITAGNPVVIGAEYTIATIGSAVDFSALGGPAAAKVGDTFTATAAVNVPANASVTYDNGDAGLRKVIQNVSSRASIVYIGKANGATADGFAGPGKVRLMIENAGYQNDDGMKHDRIGEDPNDYTSGHATTLKKYLDLQDPTPGGIGSEWSVTKFVF